MKVLVSGATGLIGRALTASLRRRGDEVLTLTRQPEKAETAAVGWDPQIGRLDPTALDGVDAVVHLAGENIAGSRFTDAHKARVRESRVAGTGLLADAVAKARPKVFVSASAVGIYGDRGDTRLTEAAAPGQGFLAEVCVAWEAAAEPARLANVRTVHPRIGVVLARDGGALDKMRLPFKMGIGGRIGSGEQYMSWIALDDVVGLLEFALDRDDLNGPLNLTAPEPVTNADFTGALGKALNRPTWVPLPAFAARIALGEIADEALLASTRVIPERALAAGYRFRSPDLLDCLRGLLQPA